MKKSEAKGKTILLTDTLLNPGNAFSCFGGSNGKAANPREPKNTFFSLFS